MIKYSEYKLVCAIFSLKIKENFIDFLHTVLILSLKILRYNIVAFYTGMYQKYRTNFAYFFIQIDINFQ